MTLSKMDILGASDRAIQTVAVPEWGGDVSMRALSARERDAFELSVNDGKRKDMANLRARLLVRCLCDEQGNRIFEDSDADALGAKSARAAERLFDIARTLH